MAYANVFELAALGRIRRFGPPGLTILSIWPHIGRIIAGARANVRHGDDAGTLAASPDLFKCTRYLIAAPARPEPQKRQPTTAPAAEPSACNAARLTTSGL